MNNYCKHGVHFRYECGICADVEEMLHEEKVKTLREALITERAHRLALAENAGRWEDGPFATHEEFVEQARKEIDTEHP